jgi:hypothetical protein
MTTSAISSNGSDFRETAVEKEGYEQDAMTHLLKAYRLFMDDARCWPLLDPLMRIIDQKRGLLTEEGMDIEVADEEFVDAGVFAEEIDYEKVAERYEDVTKMIVEQGGEFCVLSKDGDKNYGCYATEDAAKERLGQIEYFAEKNLAPRSINDLHRLLGRVRKVRLADASALALMVESEIGHRTGYVCKADEERRYTLGPVYIPGEIDAHGEFTDDATLQKALWNWVKKGDRTIRLQHTRKAAGEMVELVTWPWPVTTALTLPGGEPDSVTFPSDTPFMGVIWEDWAWDLVKAGELRGYSMGGRAKRVEAEFASL